MDPAAFSCWRWCSASSCCLRWGLRFLLPKIWEHTVEGTVEEFKLKSRSKRPHCAASASKHFRMGDGSYVAVQYDVPVHHQDADAGGRDIG